MVDLNTCYYSPGTDKHNTCTHTHYCIFNKNRTKLETQITQLENKIKKIQKVKEAAINGEIIYNTELDDYYNVSVDVYTGIDGLTHSKIDVTVKDNFLNAVNIKLNNLEYDLKQLLNFRLDILHGKIGGYGL